MNLLNKKDYTEQKNKILAAFPASVKNDVQIVLDIIPFSDNKIKFSDGKIYGLSDLVDSSKFTVNIEGEKIIIPGRVYFNEPEQSDEYKLSENQTTILNCIYLLHHDGHVRERRLKNLIHKNQIWITPFTINLFGEYVYAILLVLDEIITSENISTYVLFIKENPDFWQLNSKRMVSYWNEFYRRKFPKLNEYIGNDLRKRLSKNVA